jgi:hypothetical protein
MEYKRIQFVVCTPEKRYVVERKLSIPALVLGYKTVGNIFLEKETIPEFVYCLEKSEGFAIVLEKKEIEWYFDHNILLGIGHKSIMNCVEPVIRKARRIDHKSMIKSYFKSRENSSFHDFLVGKKELSSVSFKMERPERMNYTRISQKTIYFDIVRERKAESISSSISDSSIDSQKGEYIILINLFNIENIEKEVLELSRKFALEEFTCENGIFMIINHKVAILHDVETNKRCAGVHGGEVCNIGEYAKIIHLEDDSKLSCKMIYDLITNYPLE